MPINIIIGKNSSGKSSLLSILPYMVSPNEAFISENKNMEVIVSQILSEQIIRKKFPETAMGGLLRNYINHFEYGQKFIGTRIYFKFNGNQKRLFHTDIPIEFNNLRIDFEDIVKNISDPFLNKRIFSVAAERNIVPEPESTEFDIKPGGEGITTLITKIINNVDYDRSLIEQKLFNELAKILEPDIYLERIFPQKHGNNHWEIFLDSPDGKNIALSKMGSGIKTIIQVLINLFVLPVIKKVPIHNCIFIFEELENNLHPAMQRRIFEFLKKFTIDNDTTLFITTHSNIVIDIFGKEENAQIVHIKKQDGKAVAQSISTFDHNKIILKDLDVRASDILQSNGIIWVEGPSDRVYINKWISLIDPNLKEGVHYSILPYGGRVLANFSFDFDYLEAELIPLLKINTNAFVVIDRDGASNAANLNATKVRVQEEIGENKCWITEGREIENYLSKQTIEKWLRERHNIVLDVTIDSNEKIEALLKNSNIKYAEKKNLYSKEIADFIEQEDMVVLDLNSKINSIVNCIRDWN